MAQTRKSYDAVAQRYADEIGGELAGKPLDRALLACLAELCGPAHRAARADGIGRGHDRAQADRRPELGGAALPIADVGCGPGQMTAFLAGLGAPVVGVDLSPGMVDVARRRLPDLTFTVGSLLDLPVADGGWAGAVCAYSIIHLTADERPVAYAELARAVVPGGWLLASFHIDDGEPVRHLDEWWGQSVDLDFYFLHPVEVTAGLEAAGFTVTARTDRRANSEIEVETRRCYLLAQRRS